MNHEPTDLDLAILDRLQLQLVPFGPLTREGAETEAAYERFQEEQEAEWNAQQAAGGRTICPECGERSVVHGSAVTLGYAGHPGAEWSETSECERCPYRDLA